MIPAKDVVVGFMQDMNGWEKRCLQREQECIAAAMRFEDAERMGMQEYMEIFRKWCSSKKAVPRYFSYTDPPDYDSTKESILQVVQMTPEMIEIRTQQTYGHRKSHVFRLTLEDGQWRLYERCIVLDSDEELAASL